MYTLEEEFWNVVNCNELIYPNGKQLGMASGLETLCGQAYGARQYQKLGIHTYRANFSLLLVCLPISFIWISMGKLLSFIGQDPLISLEAGKFTFWMIPGLFKGLCYCSTANEIPSVSEPNTTNAPKLHCNPLSSYSLILVLGIQNRVGHHGGCSIFKHITLGVHVYTWIIYPVLSFLQTNSIPTLKGGIYWD